MRGTREDAGRSAGPQRDAACASPAADAPWLSGLNSSQQQAVTHGDGPLLVVAGAGSGKTRTLACRVAYLMAAGIDPARILLLTFTRRAAEEMLRRAAAAAGKGSRAAGRVWGGTFHAMANRLLRVYGGSAGLEPGFTVLDRADAEDLMNVVRHELGLHSRQKRFPRKQTCTSVYSRCVNAGEELAPVLRRYFPWCADWEDELKRLFRAYVERKQQRNVLDYDDLLLYWRLLAQREDTGTRMASRFDHILVDEYQDTNRVQADILQAMRRTNRNLMAVGDDAQSIYSFRAATVRNMLDFPKQFAGATVIKLEQNYRSVGAVLTLTNRVIAGSRQRYAKNLWSTRETGQKPRLVTCRDEDQQDAYVLARVLEHYEQGIALRRQAVLFRAAHHSDSLEVALSRANVPYRKYGGLRFLEAAHVKDLLAFLRIVENPRDELAWFRILQLFDGIGPATAARAVRHVQAHADDPRSIRSFAAPCAASASLSSFAALIDDLVRRPPAEPAAELERIRRFYDPFLERLYENAGVRSRDLESLQHIAEGYRSRRRFLADLQLDPPSSTCDLAGPALKDEDWLVLSTIHSAKGCEWDVVYLIHATDGCLPSDMAAGSADEIEEERRLAYVAMTRARDFLYVTRPLRYYHRWGGLTDRHCFGQLSRFFTADALRAVERVAVEVPDTTAAADPGVSTADGESIRAELRDMWR